MDGRIDGWTLDRYEDAFFGLNMFKLKSSCFWTFGILRRVADLIYLNRTCKFEPKIHLVSDYRLHLEQGALPLPIPFYTDRS